MTAGLEVGELPLGSVRLPHFAIWGNLVVYVVAWVLLMWPHHVPLGRPGIAMVFAALACGVRGLCAIAWPDEHYPTVDILSKIDPTPINLLFGLMLVNVYLKDTGLWGHVEYCLDAASPGVVLAKICACSALMSAFLLNDTTCFVLTPIVLNLRAKHNLPTALPYLLGVSMSANIGSSLTIIGNPQNALIASICPRIKFVGFMKDMFGPVVVGLVLNTGWLLAWFRKDLVAGSTYEVEKAEAKNSGTTADLEQAADAAPAPVEVQRSWLVYSAVVAVVVASMVACWALGLATDDVALAAGTLLMFARAIRRRWEGDRGFITETEFGLGAVDYPLLLLFIGQFILVGATVDTGLPQRMFQGILGSCASSLGGSFGCLFWFSAVVLLLSNVISNVPVILMLAPLLAHQPDDSVKELWTVCAWVATVAGNLTMLGSAANLIVASTAEGRGERGFTSLNYGKVSVFPTLVVAVIGVLLMPPVGPEWGWAIGATALAALCGTVVPAYLLLRCRSVALLPPPASGSESPFCDVSSLDSPPPPSCTPPTLAEAVQEGGTDAAGRTAPKKPPFAKPNGCIQAASWCRVQ